MSAPVELPIDFYADDVLADPFAIYPAIRDAGVAVQLVRPRSVLTSSPSTDGRTSS
jgi:hypothetical protein